VHHSCASEDPGSGCCRLQQSNGRIQAVGSVVKRSWHFTQVYVYFMQLQVYFHKEAFAWMRKPMSTHISEAAGKPQSCLRACLLN
jgi:hypothetical protein